MNWKPNNRSHQTPLGAVYTETEKTSMPHGVNELPRGAWLAGIPPRGRYSVLNTLNRGLKSCQAFFLPFFLRNGRINHQHIQTEGAEPQRDGFTQISQIQFHTDLGKKTFIKQRDRATERTDI